ncbi:hypothetical protein SMJ63A_50174 [Stenotrophomonas geniculata]
MNWSRPLPIRSSASSLGSSVTATSSDMASFHWLQIESLDAINPNILLLGSGRTANRPAPHQPKGVYTLGWLASS